MEACVQGLWVSVTTKNWARAAGDMGDVWEVVTKEERLGGGEEW